MPNVDVLTSEEISRDREIVAAFACEPDNAPRWYENIEGVEWLTPRPLAVGTRLRFRARFLWRQLDYTYEVTTYEPGAKLVMRTHTGPFPMETSYTFVSVAPARTLIELRNRGKPSGFARVMAPFMEPAMRKANRKDLSVLKRLLEGGITDS
jgi:hypothetical protein